jgi:hypothetical protein
MRLIGKSASSRNRRKRDAYSRTEMQSAACPRLGAELSTTAI